MRVTVPVKPSEGVMVMVPVVEPPGATVALVGLTVTAKEPVGTALPTVRVMDAGGGGEGRIAGVRGGDGCERRRWWS